VSSTQAVGTPADDSDTSQTSYATKIPLKFENRYVSLCNLMEILFFCEHQSGSQGCLFPRIVMPDTPLDSEKDFLLRAHKARYYRRIQDVQLSLKE
jgi:hypothetical protein